MFRSFSLLDFKLGGRMLVRYPGLTIIATFALAVAIGSGAAYLGFVNNLFRPDLPFEDADAVVGIYKIAGSASAPALPTAEEFAQWRARLELVEDLASYRPIERNLFGPDGSVAPVRGVAIDASAFRALRVQAARGRTLLPSDQHAGAPAVVVLGHALWQERFKANPAIVGRQIRLGDTSYRVVGVMPENFAFPVNQSFWLPQGDVPPIAPVRVFGRLAPGATLAQAQTELASSVARVAPYVESIWGSTRDGALQRRILDFVNLFFVGLLAVCAANVATLVFARTATREAEITVRSALGASRSRIVAQLFAEALVLATLAALVGLSAGTLALRWLKQTIAARAAVPFWWQDGLTPATLLYAAMLTVFAAALIGVVPALKATTNRLHTRLKRAAVGGPSIQFGRLWTGVIITQVALTAAFLMISVLVGWNVGSGRYGSLRVAFPSEQFLFARMAMDRDTVPGVSPGQADSAYHARFDAAFRQLETALAADPAVQQVTYASRLPGITHPFIDIEVAGVQRPALWTRWSAVAPDFFDAFDARILAGRSFTATDYGPDAAVVIVDQTFVKQILGGEDAIGRHVRIAALPDSTTAGRWHRIVGVVANLASHAHRAENDPVLYRPAVLGSEPELFAAVRVRGDAQTFVPAMGRIGAAIDPTFRLYEPRPLAEALRMDPVAASLALTGFAAVGVISLLLATAGLYSMMSFTVARRTREIGIRAALGAAPARVLAGVFRRAITQLGIGILLGVLPGAALVIWGAPEVAGGAGPLTGVAALLAVASFMLAVGALAAFVPARRALRIQPTEAFKEGWT